MLDVINKIDKWKSECRCSECNAHYITNHYDAKKSKLGHLCNDCKNIDINNLSQTLLKNTITMTLIQENLLLNYLHIFIM